jgi:flagellar motor switch protein FliN/FliY
MSETETASAPATAVSPPSAAGSTLTHRPEGDRAAMNWSDPGENPALAGLPLQLNVAVAIPNFRVRDLLALEKGLVFATAWPYPDDVPVWCGGAQVVWSEFEVVDDVLAVRVTRVL